MNELLCIEQKLVSGVASLLFKLCGRTDGERMQKREQQQHQAEQVSHSNDPQLQPPDCFESQSVWKEEKVTIGTLIAALCWRVFVPEKELDFLFPRAPFLQMLIHHVLKGDCSL